MRNVAGLTLRGMTGAAVEVEAEITGGMPAFAVVGLPDTAVKEARERVRAALRTVNVLLRGRVSVNLAPADLPKEGAMLDLPIAVALAEKAGRVRTERPALYIGELALDGRLRARERHGALRAAGERRGGLDSRGRPRVERAGPSKPRHAFARREIP